MIVAERGGYLGRLTKRKIDRLTASGMPVIAGAIYNKDGRRRGYTGFHCPRIEPWTDLHNIRYLKERRDELFHQLRGPMRNLDGYSLEEIAAACKELRSKP